jgi:ribosomal protein S6--L-glutamate ligase
MKLLILTRSKNAYAQGRFKKEAAKRGIETSVFNYAHLCFHLEKNNFWIKSINGDDLAEFNLVILRSPGLERRYLWQERVLVDYLAGLGKTIINQESLQKFPGDFDKLWQNWVFYQKKLPFLLTESYGFRDFFQKRKPPFALKRIFGSLGRDFTLIKNRQELEKFLARRHPYEFLCQPFLTTGEDYRIIVLGDKVLGVMKRIAKKGAIVSNIAAGGRAERGEATRELAELALKAAKSLSCEFVGVDIMYDQKGSPFILEANRYVIFKGFEKVTGSNVAGKVIDYLIKKNKRIKG